MEAHGTCADDQFSVEYRIQRNEVTAMSGYWKVVGLLVVTGALITGYSLKAEKQAKQAKPLDHFDRAIVAHSRDLVEDGREVFRFNTFGDESFWGDTLELHKAIEGSKFGGVGPGLSPAAAAAVGLNIDVDALPQYNVADTAIRRWNQSQSRSEIPWTGLPLW